MNSRKGIICAAALLLGVISASASAAVRIGVDTFTCGASNIDPAVAESMTEMFITELSKSGAFEVYERTRLESVAREQRLSMSGMVSPDTLVRVGRLAGVEWIITGAVTQFTESNSGGVIPIGDFGLALGNYTGVVTIDIRTIDTTTGAVTSAVRQEGRASRSTNAIAYEGAVIGGTEYGGVGAEAAMKAVKKAVRELERRIGGVEYHVIKVQSDSALIDIGSTRGAEKGALYAVYGEGDVIRDHRGNILDTEKVYYALLKVVEVKPNYSRCTYVAEKGGPRLIRTGDPIESIEPGAPARALPIAKRRKMPTIDFDAPPAASAPGSAPMPPASAHRYADEGGPVFRPDSKVDINKCTDERLILAYNIPDNRRNSMQILYKNGARLYKGKNYSKAYNMFVRATDSNFDVLNIYWAGMSALKSGNRANARKWLNKALEIHPDYIPAQRALNQLR
ncbi:MAG: CsgG/HfaB family protein [Pyramidobacter sp.]|nr:CsgG/HfaB family protein [Pyramidobacter sp.]